MENKNILSLNETLRKEFASIGFSVKDITEQPVHVSTYSTLIRTKLTIASLPGNVALFSFLVLNPVGTKDCFIDYIHIRLADSSDIDDKVLYENEFFRAQGPLPSKEKMLSEMLNSQRLAEVREFLNTSQDSAHPQKVSDKK